MEITLELRIPLVLCLAYRPLVLAIVMLANVSLFYIAYILHVHRYAKYLTYRVLDKLTYKILDVPSTKYLPGIMSREF